ncbi:MAG: PTS fructose transporter subunit IIA [Paracoccaceae bacterium]|nr:PTS fructose transporter subunit IIA [Paracoccaceae bacterium]
MITDDKIGVVIVGHGTLARAYLEAIEHVVGKQSGVRAVTISADCDRTAKQLEICEAADAVDCGHGVVLVIDLFGSSPCNLSMPACNCSARKIVCGANVPMLLKLVKSRHLPLDDAVAACADAGRKYINVCEGSGPTLRRRTNGAEDSDEVHADHPQ